MTSDRNRYARDLMTTEVLSIRPDMPVTSLARVLAERGLSSAPVTDGQGRLLGIVTEADLLRRIAGAEDTPVSWLRGLFSDASRQAQTYARTHGTTAQDVMTTQLVTVESGATVAHCAQLMERHRIKRLPVMEDGFLVGVISRSDLLRAALEPPEKPGTEVEGSDESIRRSLRKAIHEQPWVDTLYTFVDVEDGVVTLHGFVRSDEVRHGLRVLAGRINGVARVEDRMADAPRAFVGR